MHDEEFLKQILCDIFGKPYVIEVGDIINGSDNEFLSIRSP